MFAYRSCKFLRSALWHQGFLCNPGVPLCVSESENGGHEDDRGHTGVHQGEERGGGEGGEQSDPLDRGYLVRGVDGKHERERWGDPLGGAMEREVNLEARWGDPLGGATEQIFRSRGGFGGDLALSGTENNRDDRNKPWENYPRRGNTASNETLTLETS